MAFSVSGLTIQQILDMDQKAIDALKLSPSEMRKLTSRLVSAANKRLTRLEKAGVAQDSYAYRNAMQYTKSTKGRFSVAGKGPGEIKVTFKQLKQFLNPKNKTNTVRGTRASKQKLDKLVGGMSPDEKAKFFDLLHKLQNNDTLFNSYNYIEDDIFVEGMRIGAMNGLDTEELYHIMEARLSEVYENWKMGNTDYAKTNDSGFYQVSDTSDLPFD